MPGNRLRRAGGCRWLALACLVVLSSRAAERPKVGLVLSGGGARGFAHIGVLKMLDSLDVPIDCIAGTSMGGIVGALYAIGYRGRDLEALANRSDWQEMFTDRAPRSLMPYLEKKESDRYQIEFGMKGWKPVTPGGLIVGRKISLLFASLTFPYEKVDDFDRLPIPYRCVASDLIRGEAVVLSRGSLARAMRATMAIPTVFSAVEWGDSLLVDGGLLDNLPVDAAKAMGADVVIAVDVGYPLRDKGSLQSAFAVLEQSMAMLGIDRRKENVKQVDLFIQPDLAGFNMADFTADGIRRIILRGDEAARRNRKALADLKTRLGLTAESDSARSAATPDTLRVEDVQITGHTTAPFPWLLSKINLRPGDAFDPKAVKHRLSEIKAEGRFESLDLEAVPVSDRRVRVRIRVEERRKPLIREIAVRGNGNLPAAFVSRLLGYRPGDRLDTDVLTRRIMEMYGFGYFESIWYDVDPVGTDAIRLILTVKEAPFRKLRLGIRYDELHKLIGLASLQANSVLIPGLHLQNELQFAGLVRWKTKAFYPSLNLALPAYPFVEINVHDIPKRLFDHEGGQIAQYRDRAADAGIGLGFLTGKSFNLEIAYRYEAVRIHPDILVPGESVSLDISDDLHLIRADMDIDALDDVFVPRRGLRIGALFERCFPGSPARLSYSRMDFSADTYATWRRKHTFRFFGYACNSTAGTPVYKFFNCGRPETFVGLQYDQLITGRMEVLRLEYRYQHKKDIFFKFAANTAFGFQRDYPAFEHHKNGLWGIGLGVMLISPLGPIEAGVGRGSRGFERPAEAQNVFYFSLGYKF
jgi:NTE family protein